MRGVVSCEPIEDKPAAKRGRESMDDGENAVTTNDDFVFNKKSKLTQWDAQMIDCRQNNTIEWIID